MTLEEKKEQVKNFRPIDDTFFEVLADDIGVCQEMLRIILKDEKLIVKDVIVQSSEEESIWTFCPSGCTLYPRRWKESAMWSYSVLTMITI